MRALNILSLCAVLALLPVSAHAAAAGFAGHVREVTGDATLTHIGTAAKPVHVGDDILEGDKIETADKARVRISLADDSDLIIAQKGSFSVDKYLYDEKKPKEGKAEFTLLGAAISFSSGWMDKGKDSDVKLNLNYGSIGIRGTKFERAMTKGECWIYLEKGAIDVYNKGGKVTLAPGEGTIMRATTTAPEKPHVWPKREKKWIAAQVTGETSSWKP